MSVTCRAGTIFSRLTSFRLFLTGPTMYLPNGSLFKALVVNQAAPRQVIKIIGTVIKGCSFADIGMYKITKTLINTLCVR
ncbi:hypothetical protein D3C77_648380 [compost metagenome]